MFAKTTLGGHDWIIYTDKDFLALEAIRDISAGAGNITIGAHEHIAAVQIDGAAEEVSPPTAPVLTVKALSPTSIQLDFPGGVLCEYIRAYYKSTGAYAQSGGDITVGTLIITGLTAGTAYTCKVLAFNDGAPAGVASNEAGITTYETAYLPDTDYVTELLDSIRAAILEIKTSTGAAVFTSDNVEVGEISGLESRDQASGFPCIGMIVLDDYATGATSQRDIGTKTRFRLFLHYVNSTPDRANGADMKYLRRLTASVLRQMYRFYDKEQSGTTPCTGFRLVSDDYKAECWYQIWSKKVNTAIIDIAFETETSDILL